MHARRLSWRPRPIRRGTIDPTRPDPVADRPDRPRPVPGAARADPPDHPDPDHGLHRRSPRERPPPDRRRGPPRPGRRGQRLVRRRLQARAAGQDRLRAPLRARDVPGLQARGQGRAHRARAGRRRDDERHDLAGPDELLRDDAVAPARPRPVARGGPDGDAARCAQPGEPRQPARGREEREALVVRQPPVRHVAGEAPGPSLPARASLPPLHDRLDGGSRRRLDRGRQRVLPDLLRAEQRRAVGRG